MAYLKVKKTVARNPRKKRKVSRTKSAQRVARTRTRKRAKSRRNIKHKTNPVPVLISMGAVNPRKKRSRKTVARKRRRSKENSYSAAKRRRNPVSRVARTRRNPVRRRRNPEVFGRSVASSDTLKMVLGGLIGVTVAKTLVGMLPTNIVSNGLFRVVATGALAFGAGAIAKQTGLGPGFADAVTFGGLMQAGSTALTEFVPGGSRIALAGTRRGVGDLVPAKFVAPNNPLKLAAASVASTAMAPPVAAANGVSGLRPVFQRRF